MLVTLSACGSDENEFTDTSDAVVDEEETESAESDDMEETESAGSDDAEETEATVVYKDDMVKVTYLRLYEEPDLGVEGVAYLQFEVVNKTDEKITVYPVDSYVNDTQVTIGSGVAMEIDAGKKSRNPFIVYFGTTGIESVKDIESIELKFDIRDDSLDLLDETDTITVPL